MLQISSNLFHHRLRFLIVDMSNPSRPFNSIHIEQVSRSKMIPHKRSTHFHGKTCNRYGSDWGFEIEITNDTTVFAVHDSQSRFDNLNLVSNTDTDGVDTEGEG